MKNAGYIKWILMFFFILFAMQVAGQNEKESSLEKEEQQESIAERNEQQEEDDISAEELKAWRNHPLNLNNADADDLKRLTMLSGLQIEHLIQYRKLLGKLVSIYELQSIPFWNIITIRNILPYVTIAGDQQLYAGLKTRLTKGNEMTLLRYSQVPERSNGYIIRGDSASHYQGSGLNLFLKYKYSYKNILQYGLAAEKDAGEQFFKGKQRYGFDFYSFHFFLRRSGIVKALALGDFSVNMGQGLILWQGMGVGKSSDAMNIERQAPVLKPYNSAGEYNFQRGAGITLSWRDLETTAFISKRKLDAVTEDGAAGKIITSINASGYHRTQNEIMHKGSTQQTTTGFNVKYRGTGWFGSINLVNYRYSGSIQKRDEPYNFYTLRGTSFTYAGGDYGYTYKNIHFFGEFAMMNAKSTALLSGLLISLDKRAEAAILFRNISKAYVSGYGNAFTENTYPGNEQGLYAGITCRPSATISIAAYADIFSFPWLKYRVDKSSYGKEYLLHITYKPDKKNEVYIRYRYKTKEINESMADRQMSQVGQAPVQNLRLHVSTEIAPYLTIRNRAEISWYRYMLKGSEQGCLLFTDLIFRPMNSSWSFNIRYACFDTDGYNSRIYAYENDVLYSSSINAFYDKANRYFINVSKMIPVNKIGKNKKLTICVKWSQSIHNQSVIGTGLDEIAGKVKSGLKIELILL